MPIESEIIDGIVYTELSGEINLDSIKQHIDFMITLKDKMANRYLLHDHTHTENLNLSEDDIRAIADYSKKLKHIFKHSFLAVYAPQALSFGMARMFEMVFELEEHPIVAKIFKDKDEALHFLNIKMMQYGQQRRDALDR